MKIVYHAANSIDAHLIKDILAQHDITTMIKGEFLQGGMGELPVNDLVQVLVADIDYTNAKQLIAEWDAGTWEADAPETE